MAQDFDWDLLRGLGRLQDGIKKGEHQAHPFYFWNGSLVVLNHIIY